MKLVIDMNLSPDWISHLEGGGHNAVHWSKVGLPDATDREILDWARENNYVVFTHDLDFGAILAATDANSPSVVQIRTQDPTPVFCAEILLDVLRQYTLQLASGALISIDEERTRIRLLPLQRVGI